MPSHVKNMTGTSRRKCRCSVGPKSWLGHWQRGSGLARPFKCAARGCRRRVQVGAHVRLIGSDGRVPWIVPFCQFHNKRHRSMRIALKPGVTLVGAAARDCA